MAFWGIEFGGEIPFSLKLKNTIKYQHDLWFLMWTFTSVWYLFHCEVILNPLSLPFRRKSLDILLTSIWGFCSISLGVEGLHILFKILLNDFSDVLLFWFTHSPHFSTFISTFISFILFCEISSLTLCSSSLHRLNVYDSLKCKQWNLTLGMTILESKGFWRWCIYES